MLSKATWAGGTSQPESTPYSFQFRVKTPDFPQYFLFLLHFLPTSLQWFLHRLHVKCSGAFFHTVLERQLRPRQMVILWHHAANRLCGYDMSVITSEEMIFACIIIILAVPEETSLHGWNGSFLFQQIQRCISLVDTRSVRNSKSNVCSSRECHLPILWVSFEYLSFSSTLPLSSTPYQKILVSSMYISQTRAFLQMLYRCAFSSSSFFIRSFSCLNFANSRCIAANSFS